MQAHEQRSTILALALVMVVGCDTGSKAQGEGEAKAADARAAAGSENAAAKAADAKAADAKAADAKAAEPTAAASDEPRFTKDIRKDPCALLTAEQVAKAAGVEASALKNRTISGMCMYEWGEDGAAMLGFVTVAETPEKALERFEQAYRSMSGEEVAAAMEMIGDKTKEKLEEDAKEGKATADPAHAKPVVGAMGKALDEGFQYEPVTGVGDVALWDATKRTTSFGGREFVSYGNELKVLVSNMYFTLQFRAGPADEEYREQAVALAKDVVAAL